jgi:hypothetical protein
VSSICSATAMSLSAISLRRSTVCGPADGRAGRRPHRPGAPGPPRGGGRGRQEPLPGALLIAGRASASPSDSSQLPAGARSSVGLQGDGALVEPGRQRIGMQREGPIARVAERPDRSFDELLAHDPTGVGVLGGAEVVRRQHLGEVLTTGERFDPSPDERAHAAPLRAAAGRRRGARSRRQRREPDRGGVGVAASPTWPTVKEIGTGRREHEDRNAAGPVDDVIHEVQQCVVRPMQVVDDEDERLFLRQRLQEPPPGGEGLATSVAGAEIVGIDADQRPLMPFDPRGLRRLRDDRRDGAVDLARRPLVAVRVEHARERSHDLTERPERGSLAVRQG